MLLWNVKWRCSECFMEWCILGYLWQDVVFISAQCLLVLSKSYIPSSESAIEISWRHHKLCTNKRNISLWVRAWKCELRFTSCDVSTSCVQTNTVSKQRFQISQLAIFGIFTLYFQVSINCESSVWKFKIWRRLLIGLILTDIVLFRMPRLH